VPSKAKRGNNFRAQCGHLRGAFKGKKRSVKQLKGDAIVLKCESPSGDRIQGRRGSFFSLGVRTSILVSGGNGIRQYYSENFL